MKLSFCCPALGGSNKYTKRAAVLATAFALGCGGSTTETDVFGSDTSFDVADLGVDTAVGDVASDAVSEASDGFVLGCTPVCKDTEVCSTTRTCIPKGSCIATADCAPGLTCDVTKKLCVPDTTCGSVSAEAALIPPNLLIVLDRSCSMTEKVGTKTKWAIGVEAIKLLTTKYKSKIQFGLTLFPDNEGETCSQGKIPIRPGAGNEAKIADLLTKSLVSTDPYYPDGPCVTNIDTGIQQASLEPSLLDPTRLNYVLLMTDGAQSAGCKLAGADKGTESLLASMLKSKITSFVVGFGGGVDATSLNAFAVAGGAPTADPKVRYFKAEDAASLEAALSSIGSKTLGCTFALSKKPDDPRGIYAFFDGTSEVPRDAAKAEGWEYDPTTNTVTFYGTACEKIKTEVVKKVDIVLGCKKPLPA